jgi:hypothetical protein
MDFLSGTEEAEGGWWFQHICAGVAGMIGWRAGYLLFYRYPVFHFGMIGD